MVFKRFLPVVMAGILVLDTPVTAYAAGSGGKNVGGGVNQS